MHEKNKIRVPKVWGYAIVCGLSYSSRGRSIKYVFNELPTANFRSWPLHFQRYRVSSRMWPNRDLRARLGRIVFGLILASLTEQVISRIFFGVRKKRVSSRRWPNRDLRARLGRIVFGSILVSLTEQVISRIFFRR